MKILYVRKSETVANLAFEFEVSKRTILRDVSVLSNSEPIYGQSGRYGGGVYILDSYNPTIIYMSNESISLLKNIGIEGGNLILNDSEIKTLNRIIEVYEKPKK